MADKAASQIRLNETRDNLRETNNTVIYNILILIETV